LSSLLVGTLSESSDSLFSFQIEVEDPRNNYKYVFDCDCEIGKAGRWYNVQGKHYETEPNYYGMYIKTWNIVKKKCFQDIFYDVVSRFTGGANCDQHISACFLVKRPFDCRNGYHLVNDKCEG
jgi:hypothetical protein